jgi:hypothetical protein
VDKHGRLFAPHPADFHSRKTADHSQHWSTYLYSVPCSSAYSLFSQVLFFTMDTNKGGDAATRSGKPSSPAAGSVDEREETALTHTMDETTDDIVVYHYNDGDDDDLQPSSEWSAIENKNVFRVLVFCFLDGASHSIWRQDPFQVLIKQLGGDKAVGWMSGVSGVTQMIAALGAGYVGASVKHETVLRVGSIVGLQMIVLAMIAAARRSLPLFFVSQGLCGIYAGICATTTETIFADSVATGRRAFVYNVKWMDQTLSSCVGLIICIAVLFHLGNKWEESALVKTMFVGLLLHPIAMAVLWTMRDKYSLKDDDGGAVEPEEVMGGAEMDPADAGGGTVPLATGAEETPWSNGLGRPSAMRHSGEVSPESSSKRVHWGPALPAVMASPTTVVADASPTFSPAASPSGRPPRSTRQKVVQSQLEETCEVAKQEFYANVRAARGNCAKQLGYVLLYSIHFLVSWEAVPYLVCLVDFLVAFGSGMTMRYISLFFVEDYKTSPVVLLTASLLISPLTALISFLVQRAGDLYVGRLPSTIIVRLIGTTLLLLMGTTTLSLNVMLPIYIFRNALMNCTRGVTRSVIMDCVKKENRAKWSAFESFSSFTWAGSAVFGGYIAVARGYKGTFVITALFHYCSLAVLVPGAIGALPVERELMRTNRSKPHASCLMVSVAVSVIMVIASGLYMWFRSEVAKRNW